MNCDINLKHLEYFITVAELGSINKAAQSLFISQPYLGKIIKDLESAMGTVLLLRTRGGVTLTPDGREFLLHAQNVMQEMKKLLGSASQEQPSLSLTVSMTKYSHILECFAQVVARHKDEPSFSHKLSEGIADDVIEDVYSGQSSIGVIHFDGRTGDEMRSRLASRRLEYHSLCFVRPHILISREHPLLLKGSPINLQTLAPYGFARYLGQCEDFTCRIISQNARYNLNYGSRIVYLTSRSALLHLISITDFYGIGIHDFSNQISAYNVLSIPVADCSDMMEFGYFLPMGTPVSPITEEFIKELTQQMGSSD